MRSKHVYPDPDMIDGSAPISIIKQAASVSMVGQKIEVRELEVPLTSYGLERDLISSGLGVQHINFSLFSETAWGAPRPKGGTFLLVDAPPCDGLSLSDINRLTDGARTELLEACKARSEHLYNSEYDDAKKLAFQRSSFYGKNLRSPVDRDSLKVKHCLSFIKTIYRVIEHMCKMAKKKFGSKATDLEYLKSIPYDPENTNTGAPFFVPGSQDVITAREFLLTDAPKFSFTGSGAEYVKDVERWVQSYGLPSFLKSSSFLVYRMGAKIGYYPVWFRQSGGFIANYEAEAYNCDARFAWGGCYLWYIALTPAQVYMKLCRKAKLGLFHTVELSQEYMALLFKRGKNGITTDFSRYDTTQVKELQLHVCKAFMQYCPELKHQFELMHQIIDEVTMIMPFMHSIDTRMSTVLSKQNGLLSGFGFTAEMGTVLGVASMIDAMEQNGLADLAKAWFDDDHIVLVQSDDNQQYLSDEDFKRFMDVKDQYVDYIKKEQGLVLKVTEGDVFLKRMLQPGSKSMLDTSPVVARIIQNTFGNEKRVSGPYCEERAQYAFIARCVNLHKHPLGQKAVGIIKDLFSHSPVLKPVIDIVGKDVLELPRSILDGIDAYGKSTDGQKWIAELIARVEYDPVAQYMIDSFIASGIDIMSLVVDKKDKRQKMYKCLESGTTNQTIKLYLQQHSSRLLR